MAWGDGYEATTGESHINSEYMQKVITYTDDVVASDYGYLEDYGDIFLPAYKNSKESIFAVQCSDYEDDNTTYGRANWSNTLNGCWKMWSCGWDFHKPSQNLVNAFKTRNGLPMFDDYNDRKHLILEPFHLIVLKFLWTVIRKAGFIILRNVYSFLRHR